MKQYIVEKPLPIRPYILKNNISSKDKTEQSGFASLLTRASDEKKDASEKIAALTKKSKIMSVSENKKNQNSISDERTKESLLSIMQLSRKKTAKSNQSVENLRRTKNIRAHIPNHKKTDKKEIDIIKKAILQIPWEKSSKQSLFISRGIQIAQSESAQANSANMFLDKNKTASKDAKEAEAILKTHTRVEVLDQRSESASIIENLKDNKLKALLKKKNISGKNTARIRKSLFHSETSQNALTEKSDSQFLQQDQNIRIRETDINLSAKNVPRDIATALAQKIAGQDGSEIVRLVRVVLNNSDRGEVHINLRPDGLGRVRVKILMDKNRLSGQIFVDSAVAREAMRLSIDSLQARLVDSGFSSANLDLAWDEGRDDNNFREQTERKQNLFSEGKEVEDIVNSTMMDLSGVRVNITV